MTLEAHFTQVIKADAALLDMQPDDRDPDDWWYQMSSVGLGEDQPVPDRWYMVWNEGSEYVHQAVRETSNAKDRTIRFYVYDHKGDFTRINKVLEHLERIVKTMGAFTTDDGYRVSESLWLGASQLFNDDGWNSCCRYGTARFTVSS